MCKSQHVIKLILQNCKVIKTTCNEILLINEDNYAIIMQFIMIIIAHQMLSLFIDFKNSTGWV